MKVCNNVSPQNESVHTPLTTACNIRQRSSSYATIGSPFLDSPVVPSEYSSIPPPGTQLKDVFATPTFEDTQIINFMDNESCSSDIESESFFHGILNSLLSMKSTPNNAHSQSIVSETTVRRVSFAQRSPQIDFNTHNHFSGMDFASELGNVLDASSPLLSTENECNINATVKRKKKPKHLKVAQEQFKIGDLVSEVDGNKMKGHIGKIIERANGYNLILLKTPSANAGEKVYMRKHKIQKVCTPSEAVGIGDVVQCSLRGKKTMNVVAKANGYSVVTSSEEKSHVFVATNKLTKRRVLPQNTKRPRPEITHRDHMRIVAAKREQELDTQRENRDARQKRRRILRFWKP